MPSSDILISAALLLILAVAGTLLLLQRYRSQRPYSTAISSIDMAEVWNLWRAGAELGEVQQSIQEYLLEQVDDATLDAVRDDLLAFEKRINAGRYPLTQIRKELMASVDRRMLNTEILQLPPQVRRRLREQSPEIIQSDDQARRYIVANEIRLAVLREYAARKYGDRADDDWFAVYERASAIKQKTAQAFIQRSLKGGELQAEDARHQAMTLVDNELRARLLTVPPGTRFSRAADKAGGQGEEPRGD
ncbi:MAG: hypothetical protein PVJ40_04920 [Gammaproteobacteria bacterium]|jgi:hypothetical protein